MTQEKLALLSSIKTLKQEMLRQFEAIEERVVALEDNRQQPVQIQPFTNEWMTAKELARHFKVSTGTIYAWEEKGIIPSGTAFGPRQTRWKLADVEACQGAIQADSTTGKRRGRPSRVHRKEEFYD